MPPVTKSGRFCNDDLAPDVGIFFWEDHSSYLKKAPEAGKSLVINSCFLCTSACLNIHFDYASAYPLLGEHHRPVHSSDVPNN
jgi:hypothetical protein